MNEPMTRPIAARSSDDAACFELLRRIVRWLTRQVRKAMIAAAAQVAVESQGLWRKLVLSA